MNIAKKPWPIVRLSTLIVLALVAALPAMADVSPCEAYCFGLCQAFCRVEFGTSCAYVEFTGWELDDCTCDFSWCYPRPQ